MKRILLPILVIGVLFLGACGALTTPPAEEPAASLAVLLSFPDGAPPLNQEAELVCTVNAPARSAKNMSVSVNLPEALELVSGELSWSGDVAEGDEVEIIRAVVRSVKTGNWTIELNRYLDPEENRGFGFQNPDPFYISISEDSAEWGTTPPWYKDGDHEVPIKVVDETSSPIVDLSISHAPLVNEPAEITCTVTTLIDYPNMNAQIKSTYGDALALVDGSLEWHGDLIANVPATFSAQVVFRYSGYYNIGWRVWQTGKEYSWANPGLICLIIGEDESSFCEKPPLILPPPPE